MKKMSFGVAVIAAFILSALAALAADAAAPTAHATPKGEWLTADFIRTLLSVAAGGVISGIVALGLAFINNRNALRLNQQKIDADKEKLEIEFKFKKQENDENEKRQKQSEFTKEKELHYKELIKKLKPTNLLNNLDNDDSDIDTSTLLYVDSNKYLPYIKRMLELRKNKTCIRNVASFYCTEKNSMTEEEIILLAKLRLYWSALIFATQRDLQGEKIPPLEELAELEATLFEQFYAEVKQEADERTCSGE